MFFILLSEAFSYLHKRLRARSRCGFVVILSEVSRKFRESPASFHSFFSSILDILNLYDIETYLNPKPSADDSERPKPCTLNSNCPPTCHKAISGCTRCMKEGSYCPKAAAPVRMTMSALRNSTVSCAVTPPSISATSSTATLPTPRKAFFV